MQTRQFTINDRPIGNGHPCFIIAELSANHLQQFDHACNLIRAAREAGADAVKVQTLRAGTITLQCDNDYFRVGAGTSWEGRLLHDLYQEAEMPWEWQPKLQQLARSLGLEFFSTPFDASAVDFLERMDVPAYKIASFEIVDLQLIQKVAGTGKPIIISTGMATIAEIEEALAAARAAGAREIALLKCTSAYPAPPAEMNLRTMADMAVRFGVPVGLSDHTLGATAAITAVALGACIVEKHLTLSRAAGGPDSSFSMEPAEFASMVSEIRTAEAALGSVSYQVTEHEAAGKVFRRSLFVVEDMRQGEQFTTANVRSIRPGYGLAPKLLPQVLGKAAGADIPAGTPLTADLIAKGLKTTYPPVGIDRV